MSSAPVLVLDIDGVVSLAQPGSAEPWYATLKQDLGLDYEEIERDFFQREFLEVLRGRLDLYVALHGYLELEGHRRPHGGVRRLLVREGRRDRPRRARRRPMPGASAPAGAASPPPTRSTIAPPTCATRRGWARISTRSSIRRRSASASPTACSSPAPRRAWASRRRNRSCSSTIAPPMSTARAWRAGGRCSIAGRRASAGR